MKEATVFLIDIGVVVAAALVVVAYLKSSLRKILIDLCGTEDRAGFWVAFSNVTLVLVPAIFAMHYHPVASEPVVFQAGTQLEWAMIGLAVAVLFLGIVLGRFIPRRTVRGQREMSTQSQSN